MKPHIFQPADDPDEPMTPADVARLQIAITELRELMNSPEQLIGRALALLEGTARKLV